MLPARILWPPNSMIRALTTPIRPAAGKTHQRSRRQRLQDVVEQPLHAAAENFLFALFGVIALHHAHAAERFGQPPGDFRGDFRPRAENRANGVERLVDAQCRKTRRIANATAVMTHAGVQIR